MTSTDLLRHHLAALALRLQHAVRDAPEGFAVFDPGHGVRTPSELVAHVAQVLTMAGRLVDAEDGPPPDPGAAWNERIAAVHSALARLDARIAEPDFAADADVVRRVLHGPLVDAGTHVGQLVMLRRLAGSPVPPGSYLRADVQTGRVGPDQPAPPAPTSPPAPPAPAEGEREARARTLMRALYFGQTWIADALLAADPDLPTADPALQIALFDADAVLAWLDQDPARATAPLGRRTPLLHLAFSRHLAAAPGREAAMLRIAERLLDLGADPNDGFAPDGEHRLSALYGALGHAGNLPLARLLLSQGADPNDGESLYHSTELPHADGLRLLLAHGASPAGTNALLRAVDMHDVSKVRLLLGAGADPNEAVVQVGDGVPAFGVTPLLNAARRHAPAEVADALLDAGADPSHRWAGHGAYATARIHGSDGVARALAARGWDEALTPTEAALATCAEGTAPATPIDPETLDEADRLLPTRIAGTPGRSAHLRALLDAGLSPDVTDEMGLTPLHVALWEGLPEMVELLLAREPDLNHVNAHGGDALSTLIHGSEFCPAGDRDHVGCARLLLAAGGRAPSPDEVNACGDEALAGFLRRHVRRG